MSELVSATDQSTAAEDDSCKKSGCVRYTSAELPPSAGR